MPATRSKRATLHIEPNAVYEAPDDESATPGSAATTGSPITPLVTPLSSGGSEINEGENDEDTSGGSDTVSGRRSREKRKRSRVTPEQLVHLERYFSVDRSPTAARRREISDLLGMQERQTQIWFQNRRAKAKMLDGKLRDQNATGTPPDTSSVKYNVNLHNIIHEEEAVTFIPCTDLSVGTWRRIATTVSKHDLVAYVCEAKHTLAWFILSGGNGFKMEIPFDRIVSTECTHVSPGVAHATFILSKPPLFYLESPMAPGVDGMMKLSWRQCSDWTEGAQATHVLRHELIGSAPQLSHLIHRLKLLRSGGNVSLVSHSYERGSLSSPVEIPAPPMAGLLGGPSYHNSSSNRSEVIQRPVFPNSDLSVQNSHSAMSDHRDNAFPSTSSSAFGDSVRQDLSTGMYPNSEGSTYYNHNQSMAAGNTAFVAPVSRLSTARPYSSVAETFPSMFPEDVSISHSLQSVRRHSWNNFSNYTTPSPPILTTPYHPAPDFIY